MEVDARVVSRIEAPPSSPEEAAAEECGGADSASKKQSQFLPSQRRAPSPSKGPLPPLQLHLHRVDLSVTIVLLPSRRLLISKARRAHFRPFLPSVHCLTCESIYSNDTSPNLAHTPTPPSHSPTID